MSLTKVERDRLVDEFYNRYTNGEISRNQRELLITKVNSMADMSSFMESATKIEHRSIPIDELKAKFDAYKTRLYEDCSNGVITVEQREYLILKAKDKIFMENDEFSSLEQSEDDCITEGAISTIANVFEHCIAKIKMFIADCINSIKEIFHNAQNKRMEQSIKHMIATDKDFANQKVDVVDISKINAYNRDAREKLKYAKSEDESEKIVNEYKEKVKKVLTIGGITITVAALGKLIFDLTRIERDYRQIEQSSDSHLKTFRDAAEDAFDKNAAAYMRSSKTKADTATFKHNRDAIENTYDQAYNMNKAKMYKEMDLVIDNVTHNNSFIKKGYNKICRLFFLTPRGRTNAKLNEYHNAGYDVAPDFNRNANAVASIRENASESSSSDPFSDMISTIDSELEKVTTIKESDDTNSEDTPKSDISVKLIDATTSDLDRFYKNDDYCIEKFANNRSDVDSNKDKIINSLSRIEGFDSSDEIELYLIKGSVLNKKYNLTDETTMFNPDGFSLVIPISLFKTKTDWQGVKSIINGKYFSDVIDNIAGHDA